MSSEAGRLGNPIPCAARPDPYSGSGFSWCVTFCFDPLIANEIKLKRVHILRGNLKLKMEHIAAVLVKGRNFFNIQRLGKWRLMFILPSHNNNVQGVVKAL